MGLKFKLIAAGLFVLAILVSVFKLISIGRAAERGKAAQKVISNAQKVNKARADLDADKRRKLRDRFR